MRYARRTTTSHAISKVWDLSGEERRGKVRGGGRRRERRRGEKEEERGGKRRKEEERGGKRRGGKEAAICCAISSTMAFSWTHVPLEVCHWVAHL